MLPIEITPRELERRLAGGEPLHLLDVRETGGLGVYRVQGAEPLPLRAVAHSLASLREKAGAGALVLFCHHGDQSLRVARWLRRQGVVNCRSLAGGIVRWRAAIESASPSA